MDNENLLTQADTFMKNDERERAATVLKSVLQNSPTDRQYADIVAIYLEGYMYTEALAIFQTYHQRTGKELDKVSDFTFKDILQEQAEYQRSQSTTADVPYTSGAVSLRPISPFYDFFMLLFVAVGIFPFLYVGLIDTKAAILFRIAASIFGVYMIGAGLRGMFTYLQADEEGLVVLGPRLRIKRGQPKAANLWLPEKRRIPYAAISKATVETFSAGRGIGVGMKIVLKDGSSDLVNFGPFLKRDCRELVLKVRSKGIPVFVLPGLLGKGFTAS